MNAFQDIFQEEAQFTPLDMPPWGDDPCTVRLMVNLYRNKKEEWLDIIEVDHDFPSWLSNEIGDSGWEFMLGFSCDRWHDANAFPGVARWLLEHGIAPDQIFTIRLQSPYWSGRRDHWGEYDDPEPREYEILSMEPWSAKQVARKWDQFLKWFRDQPE